MTVATNTLDLAELAALRETVTAVCAQAGGPGLSRALEAAGGGYAEGVWRTLAEDIGIAGVGLPEEVGGLGGPAELAAVAESLGAMLAPVPFLSSTVLAGQLLSRGGASANALLEGVAAGMVTAVALLDREGRWDHHRLTLRARRAEAGFTVDGVADFVLFGAEASQLVVVAATDEGPVVLSLPTDGEGVQRVRLTTLDPSRPQAKLVLDAAPATLLIGGPSATLAVDRAIDLTLLAQAAEQLGAAQAALDMTVAFVVARRQFGRAIGSFQSVKHRCADMLIKVETARSAVGRAVEAAENADSDPATLTEAAAVANAWCSQALVEIAAETVHLHGGTGFTWEHDAHLFFRRARSDAALFGDPSYHRERIAGLLGW